MRSSTVPNPAALFVAFAAAALWSSSPLAARAAGDAGPGVARVSLIAGDVAIRRGDSGAPVAAAINAPLLGADYVTTGDESRAEIAFDGASMVRLGAGVQLRFTHLDAGDRALQLAQGTIELRRWSADDGTIAIDTPSISIRSQRSGIYRVTVTGDGRTLVTVRAGEAEIVTPQDDRRLGPGTTLTAEGAATDPTLQSTGAIAYDDFDRFNNERDVRHDAALADASAYANPNLDGIDALGGYGRWVDDGSYGAVWSPFNAGPGWAPYRAGRWVWEDGYGWTWLASEPWGWAPYHYGRWYRTAAYGWCWYPPQPVELVPVWQPGIVAFFTFGGGANIGWVPLAPYEPYFPWWGYGYGQPAYVTNVINVTNVTNVYGPTTNLNGEIKRFYKNVPYGTTAQPGARFLLGKFDHPMRVQPAQFAQARLVKGALPVVPATANLRFSDAPVARELSPGTPVRRVLFAGDTSVARRIPFERQRSSIATSLRAPSIAIPAKRVASPWVRFNRAPAPVVIVGGTRAGAPAATTHGAQGATDPWSRFGERGTAAGVASHLAAPAAMPLRRDAESERIPSARVPSAARQTTTVRETTTVHQTTTVREHAGSVPVERARSAERPVQLERSVRETAPHAATVSAPQPAANTATQGAANSASQPRAVNAVPGHR